MKKLFLRAGAIFSLLALCFVSCLLLTPPAAHAAPLKSSAAARPLAVGCLIPNLVKLQDVSITFKDTLNPQEQFTLRAELFGTYNNKGEYCGKMKAEGLIFEPAHTHGGTLTVSVQQGDEQNLDTASTTTSGGGLNGITSMAETAREATEVGRVHVTYRNDDGANGFIETDPIIG